MNSTVETADTVEQQPGVITIRIRRRTLCIILAVPVLVIAVATAVLLWQLNESVRVNRAIQARGGYVYTDYYSGNLRTWVPWLGNRGEGTLTNISLENCNVTDDWLAAHDLSRLSGTITIDLTGNPISDEALRHVARYRRLSFLTLSETPVTDDGLACLRDCEELNGLSLDGTAVTDAGLVHLDGLPELSSLYLHDTQVTDAGVLHVINALPLMQLSLDASVLTPEVGSALAGKSGFYLELYGDAIPQALPLLSGTTAIQSLSLDGDSVTDDCLPDLSALTGVTYMQLTNTRITREGYDQLREALPGCTIYVWLNWEGDETE